MIVHFYSALEEHLNKIHTKAMGRAGSMLTGIDNLWRIFPIKMKFDTYATFFGLKFFCAEQN